MIVCEYSAAMVATEIYRLCVLKRLDVVWPCKSCFCVETAHELRHLL